MPGRGGRSSVGFAGEQVLDVEFPDFGQAVLERFGLGLPHPLILRFGDEVDEVGNGHKPGRQLPMQALVHVDVDKALVADEVVAGDARQDVRGQQAVHHPLLVFLNR